MYMSNAVPIVWCYVVVIIISVLLQFQALQDILQVRCTGMQGNILKQYLGKFCV